MQCEAAHKHTLDDDLAEIDQWVDWLRRKGYRSIAVIGHSWGAQHALAYTETRPDAAILAVIGVSLTRTSLPGPVGASQAKKAQALAAQASSRLQPYRLSFCKKYMGTAASYLSYQQWDDEKVVKTVAALRARGLPVAAVLGSEDKRIDARWIASLRQAGVTLSVIEGANHFFSSAHEFELVEELERMLAKVKP
jgi:pimeloyl-ACP methyl ester carboxylesterase